MYQQRTRVKICGITRSDDAHCAVNHGADAIGFVFVPASARCITPQAAADIVATLPSFANIVGLFLNADADFVEQALRHLPALVPQFHGQESAEFCDQFQRPYIKALGLKHTVPDAQSLAAYQHASGFLFDSHEPGALGGTGHAFDWSRLDASLDVPLILAGGLNVSNVQAAICRVQPYAVDVSSGVEHSKGIKDHKAIEQFMRAVSDADRMRATTGTTTS